MICRLAWAYSGFGRDFSFFGLVCIASYPLVVLCSLHGMYIAFRASKDIPPGFRVCLVCLSGHGAGEYIDTF